MAVQHGLAARKDERCTQLRRRDAPDWCAPCLTPVKGHTVPVKQRSCLTPTRLPMAKVTHVTLRPCQDAAERRQVAEMVEVAVAEMRREHPRWGSRRIRLELESADSG